MLKVLAFCLEKQKSFIPKKIFFGRSQYQNKKALFTDSIFREGFGLAIQSRYYQGNCQAAVHSCTA